MSPELWPVLFGGVVLAMVVDEDLIRKALRYADLSIAKAAQWMEMDDRLLDRQLHGEGHLKHTALMLLPSSFWRWYSLFLVQKHGLPMEVRRSARLAVVVTARRQPLRMALPTSQKEQVG